MKLIEKEIEKEKSDNNYQSPLDYKNQRCIEIERPNAGKAERNFCAGEQIIFLKNSNKDKIANSDRGTIEKITSKKNGSYDLVVKIDDKTVKFNTAKYNSFNHCNAISSHKSQGQTYDNCYHLASDKTTSNKSYVDGSRHKNEYRLYIAKDTVEGFKSNAVKEQTKATTLNDKGNEAYERLKGIFIQQHKEQKQRQLRANQEKAQADLREQQRQEELKQKEKQKQEELKQIEMLKPRKGSHDDLIENIKAKEKAILEMKNQRQIAQPTQKSKGWGLSM